MTRSRSRYGVSALAAWAQAASLASAAAIVTLAETRAHAEIGEYVVQPGDTCESISLRFWGNQLRYDKLHALNPTMGPMPHTLVPGTKLLVDKPGPDARVTAIHNKVESATPAVHSSFTNEPLSRGNTVSTEVSSHAEVTFRDTTRVQLGEQTLVVILGDASSKSAVRSSANDTTLVNGSLRAHLGDFAGKQTTVATPGARVDLGKGEAKLSVDEEKSTRLAVYSGTSSLSSAGQTVAVKDGFGSKAKLGKPPTPPRPLPDAPAWTSAPPRTLIALDVPGGGTGGASLTATYAPAAAGKGPAAARWHVELARDEKFNDFVVDATVPAEIVKLETKQLPSGTYYVRVAGIDADKFEGKFGATTITRVLAAKLIPSEAGKRAAVEPPKGSFCSLDGAPFAEVQAPLELTPAHAHVLRCLERSEKSTGEGAGEITIGEELAGAVTIVATPAAKTTGGGARLVTLTLRDGAGAPVTGAKVTATVTTPAAESGGATVDAPVETTTKGTYAALVHVPAGVTSVRVSLAVAGAGTKEITVEGEPQGAAMEGRTSARPGAAGGAADAEVGRSTWRRYELAAGLETTLPQARSALGWGAAVEVAAVIPERSFSLSIGLRGAFALRGEVDGTSVACGAAAAPSGCGGSDVFDTRFAHDSYAIGLALGFRLRVTKWLTPYVVFRPELVYDAAVTHAVSSNGAIALTTSDAVTRFAFTAGGGASFALGPGGLYVEAGYRGSNRHVVDAGAVPIGGGLLALGYRLEL
jgi:opacity protein-like surface antigen